ncbi:MAG TPA: MFS transporter [Nevskiaceae bacterium]|nr:MFS transporter [Nevskiaceae bacterium]
MASLSLVYALRMVGMFMVLPVLALYARDLPGAPGALAIGLALGIYGLTQALLQIPLGMASDRYGRVPVVVLGLLVFALGSLIAGLAEDLTWITIGRAIQGAGAVSSAVSAWLADVTRESVRTQAMALMGAGMGVAFVLALILGPPVAGWIGVPGIFLGTAVLAVLAIPLLIWGTPAPPPPRRQDRRLAGLGQALRDPALLRLDAGIFLLHAGMTGLFLAAPAAIEATLGLPLSAHWQVWLPLLLVSLLPVLPLMRLADRGHGLTLLRAGCAVLALALGLASWLHLSVPGLWICLWLFFAAFNLLEGLLPALISRQAPPAHKGAALGVYASSQFLGGFAGSLLVGAALERGGLSLAFGVAALLPLGWLILFSRRSPPAPVAAG